MRSSTTCFLLLLSWTLARSAQTLLTLGSVIERASRFAEQQRDTLSDVRADEKYVQWTELDPGRVLERRTLLSEMAFVRLTGQGDWVAYRNVIQIDDQPTGTDPARLEKLFREGPASTQGNRIVHESATYNLGGLERTLNTPVIVMHMLMPAQVKRFKFKKEGEESHPAGRTWIISLRESERPTIVRSTSRLDVPIEGRLWIVPETGAPLRATLELSHPVETQLEFNWRHDEKLDAWVPAAMRERYARVRRDDGQQRPYDIVGVATYTNYRRFTVDVKIK
jgi:hypothetical protein